MRIAIYGRLLHYEDTPYIQQLFDELHEKEMDVVIFDKFLPHLINKIQFKDELRTFSGYGDIHRSCDCLFSLGGDGTLLDTVSIVRNSNIPILGINIGRLGFLASTGKEQIGNALDALMNGTWVVDRRTLLHLDSSRPLFDGMDYALNECTIHKTDSSSMVTIDTYLNGEFLNAYWADGLIIATPTGSTAYSLSCGGPIIFPSSGNFVITPVAPHNLNVRPIVVSDDSVISFSIKGRSESFLVSLDSRHRTIDASVQIAVRKEDFSINLVRLEEVNFLTTLRNKLMLGLDRRN